MFILKINQVNIFFNCLTTTSYNIPDSSINEYSTKNTFNSGIGKYYMKRMSDIPN